MTYRLTGYRFFILVILGGLGILAAAFLVIALTTADRWLEIFLLAWMAGLAWQAYWWLGRCAWKIGIVATRRCAGAR